MMQYFGAIRNPAVPRYLYMQKDVHVIDKF